MPGIEALLSAVLGALAGLIRDLVADWKRDRDLKQIGGLEGQARLDKQVKETSDVQSSINLVDRGGARGVLERLRRGTTANGNRSG